MNCRLCSGIGIPPGNCLQNDRYRRIRFDSIRFDSDLRDGTRRPPTAVLHSEVSSLEDLSPHH